MIVTDYMARVFARAIAIRYKAGETDINALLDGYNLQGDNRTLVLAQLAALYPEIPHGGEQATA
ncbi:hypothetical protein COLU111180_12025 [Cohnella lubricantis]|uniref:Uncharacterized protein n=1 Tax=Cohnella lubricantis TaxID=2163172 RepID=A0A841TC06_9BACL|nr:hypothetical protein [Cohnella lubricantis]MBB6675971.1 hypothetical protein [Cohnella lubricantis]MBP2117910.1 hypothetical protein [Cohnella lubricantis]